MPFEVADALCDLLPADLPFKFPVASDIACIPNQKRSRRTRAHLPQCIFDKNEPIGLTI